MRNFSIDVIRTRSSLGGSSLPEGGEFAQDRMLLRTGWYTDPISCQGKTDRPVVRAPTREEVSFTDLCPPPDNSL